jgi:uncharacterized protein (TIGR02246 family)
LRYAPRTQDEALIRRIAQDWQDAWNRHDADALASRLVEDVDFVTVLGPSGWMKGREQFKDAHARMHRTLFVESVWTTRATFVRFLRPDLAIAHVLWSTTGDKVRHIKHGEPREGIFAWVLEKRNGKWMIVVSQNTESVVPLPGQ